MAHMKAFGISIKPPTRLQGLFASVAGLIVFLWPRRTSKLSYITTVERDRWYGPIQYISSPTPDNPEGIFITNNFYDQNIVRRVFPIIGLASVHRLAAPSLYSALSEIERKGWAKKIKSFNGSYNARFVRESTTNLSSHSYGTSIDINAESNPRDGQFTQDQKDLASVFERWGWYWGNRFTRPDPMHFEFVLKPAGVA